MKYIKRYEGFKIEQLRNIETSVGRYERDVNNKKNINSDKIINYDISNFHISEQSGTYIIYPDKDFLLIYKEYCKLNKLDYINNLTFECSILPYDFETKAYNLIDTIYLLPNNLQGLRLGYKIYKLLLNKKVKYLMGLRHSSNKAKNIWSYLLLDNDVYSGTNKEFNIIINKNISDKYLFDILDKINVLNIKYDDDLNERIYNRR